MRANLVIHASDLPRGRGWSPHVWQILEGSQDVVVSLIEAQDEVDTGPIWAQRHLVLEGHELHEEINSRLFAIELELMDHALELFGHATPVHQEGVPSYYPRRKPEELASGSRQINRGAIRLVASGRSQALPCVFRSAWPSISDSSLKKLELPMSETITIAGRSIGRSHRPFIIAEMSGNHNQSLDRALAIVEAAAKTGAHALKLQTYTADTMTLDLGEGEFFIDDPNSLWNGTSLHKLYQEAYTPWEWHAPIFERARALGMIPFSTPFDATAVDFLEQLGVPCYKIASFENTDLPLIRKVAATGKPMIISTGMATVAEYR